MKPETPHGEQGHLNILVRDQESEITGYGQHNRIVVYMDPKTGTITAREDIKWNLPRSTDEQRRKVMNGYQRMHPRGSRLEFIESISDSDNLSGPCIYHDYRIAKR